MSRKEKYCGSKRVRWNHHSKPLCMRSKVRICCSWRVTPCNCSRWGGKQHGRGGPLLDSLTGFAAPKWYYSVKVIRVDICLKDLNAWRFLPLIIISPPECLGFWNSNCERTSNSFLPSSQISCLRVNLFLPLVQAQKFPKTATGLGNAIWSSVGLVQWSWGTVYLPSSFHLVVPNGFQWLIVSMGDKLEGQRRFT